MFPATQPERLDRPFLNLVDRRRRRERLLFGMRFVRDEHLHLFTAVAVDVMTVTDAVLMELTTILTGHFLVFDPENDVLSGFADSGTGRL